MLSMRLAIFFAANPHEELLTSDIAAKFDVEPMHVAWSLKRRIDEGYFARTRSSAGRGRESVYTAGPLLLQIISGKVSA